MKKRYYVAALREAYREGNLDPSQIERLEAIGFDFEGYRFDPSRDSLQAQYPSIAEQWDSERNGDKTPSDVRPKSTVKAWWRCPGCGRPYRLQIRSKTLNDGGCPYCGHGGKTSKIRLPIIRLDTLKAYPSIREAEREVGYGLAYSIRNSQADKKGIRWCYLIDYEMGTVSPEAKKSRFGSVVCLETGRRFESQKAAEEELGLSRGSISRVLDGGRSAGGYHWVTEESYSQERAEEAQANLSKRKVVCLETGRRYDSYAEAARDLGIRVANIENAVRKSKSHYTSGYHFLKSSEYDDLTEEEIDGIVRQARYRAVACVETGALYESVTAAARMYPGKEKSARAIIGHCCRNPYHRFDGKHWCFAEDLQSRIDDAARYAVTTKTAVRCVETGAEYESMAEASRATGTNANGIRLVINGKRNKAGGFTWERVGEPTVKHGRRGENQPSAKKVLCIETGERFPSLNAAAQANGLCNGNSIRFAIDRGGTAAGFHWKYDGNDG